MGKRKSSSKPAPKKPTASLSRDFRCLFCHHDKTVQVKIDKGSLFGSLKCKDCGQTFSCPINPYEIALSVHVDVYSEWVDACEEVKEAKPAAPPQRPPNTLDHGFAGGARLNIQSNLARASRRAGEGELDADEDEEEEDGEADYDDRRPNGRGGRGDRLQRDEDDEEEEEEEAQESDEEERKERRKKKKIRRETEDPDEDSD